LGPSRLDLQVHASSNSGYSDSQFRVHSFPTPYPPPSALIHSPMPPIYGSQPTRPEPRGQTFIQQQNPTFGYSQLASVQASGRNRPHTTFPTGSSFPVHSTTGIPMMPPSQNHYNAQVPSYLGHSDYTARRALQNFPTATQHYATGNIPLANPPANSTVLQKIMNIPPYSQHDRSQANSPDHPMEGLVPRPGSTEWVKPKLEIDEDTYNRSDTVRTHPLVSGIILLPTTRGSDKQYVKKNMSAKTSKFVQLYQIQ
jgi:hypothetical protein